MRSAGVNPIDYKLYGGMRGGATFPMRIGMEAAGIVAAVGDDAQGPDGPWQVGDEVIGFRVPGAAAEQVARRPPRTSSPSRRTCPGRQPAG